MIIDKCTCCGDNFDDYGAVSRGEDPDSVSLCIRCAYIREGNDRIIAEEKIEELIKEIDAALEDAARGRMLARTLFSNHFSGKK